MKKLILLFTVISLILTSCTSDDSTSSQDKLIGFWTSFQSFYNGSEIILDECDKMDSILVNSDGTFTEAFFYDNNGTCVSDATDNGLWVNRGNSIYEITYDAGTIDEDVLLVTITFSNNSFTVETTDGTDTYTEVYIRS